MLHCLTRTQSLPLGLTEAWAFFSNPANLCRITPDWLAFSQSLTRTDPLGSLRETFFVNQLRFAGARIRVAARGDFIVDDIYTLEVGGKGKGFAQIGETHDGYVVRDGQEVGHGRVLPLWLFGFLY